MEAPFYAYAQNPSLNRGLEFRIWGLNSSKGGYIGDYIGEYHRAC